MEKLSQPMEDYLKAIYRLQERAGKGASTNALAAALSAVNPWDQNDPFPLPPTYESQLRRGDLSVNLGYRGVFENFEVEGLREPHELEISRIEGADLIPLGQLAGRLSELDSAEELVLFCKAGTRSSRALELLVSAGLLTSIPLLLFAAAARRLRMATIGFLQYITPTMHFLIAVVIYREPFKLSSLVSFGFIWLGLMLYSLDALQGVQDLQQLLGGPVLAPEAVHGDEGDVRPVRRQARHQVGADVERQHLMSQPFERVFDTSRRAQRPARRRWHRSLRVRASSPRAPSRRPGSRRRARSRRGRAPRGSGARAPRRSSPSYASRR